MKFLYLFIMNLFGFYITSTIYHFFRFNGIFHHTPLLTVLLLEPCFLWNTYGLVGRVFANGPGDWCSIPGQVIPKTLKKWYLIPPCLTLNNIRYVSRIKWSNPGKGVVPSPTPQCRSYWKGSLWVTLNYSRQLYIWPTACFLEDYLASYHIKSVDSFFCFKHKGI